jgi:hypothetical protein
VHERSELGDAGSGQPCLALLRDDHLLPRGNLAERAGDGTAVASKLPALVATRTASAVAATFWTRTPVRTSAPAAAARSRRKLSNSRRMMP